MSVAPRAAKSRIHESSWYHTLAKYEKPDLGRAIRQLSNTLVPYVGLWVLSVYLLQHQVPYLYVLPLMILAGGLLMRVFIFFHDCCHGSFFASKKANTLFGYLTGILVFTSFEDWRRPHARHHATAGDHDRRGVGDVWTMTVDEYLSAPLKVRIAYRLYREPLFLFLIGPTFLFVIGNRFPHRDVSNRERLSVLYTNLGIAAIATTLSFVLGHGDFWAGFKTYFSIQYPMILTAATGGVWMFYVQHQFEGTYWAKHQEWDPMTAALQGSSFYKLPKALQWLTGNIGLHHIHHLRPRIPNYRLQQAYDDIPALREVKPLTLKNSLKSLNMHLWDEANQKLISFYSLKNRQARA